MCRHPGKTLRALVAGLVLLAAGAVAQAGVVPLGGGVYEATGTSSSNQTVSATASFTWNDSANTLTLVLENTTPFTKSAGELLTAFEFEFASLSGTSSLSSAVTTAARTVARDGSYTDSTSSSDVDLLGQNTWSLSQSSGTHRIAFNPNAEYAMIGDVPSGSSDYSASNGGIRNNNGHNPFAFGPTTFVFSLPDFSGTPALDRITFVFGTSFETEVTMVPLPPAAWMGLGLLGALGVARLRRRRRLA